MQYASLIKTNDNIKKGVKCQTRNERRKEYAIGSKQFNYDKRKNKKGKDEINIC